MTEKHKQRWILEIQIMQKLQHENVISAMDVPTILDVMPNELPLLAMEYCSGGDLRRVCVVNFVLLLKVVKYL
jgi:serine/threonine protein kinase